MQLTADCVAVCTCCTSYSLALTLTMRDTSYSWSTNIAGRKRWRFFAPADAALLRRTYARTRALTCKRIS